MDNHWLPRDPAVDDSPGSETDSVAMAETLARFWDDSLSTASNLEIIGRWLQTNTTASFDP